MGPRANPNRTRIARSAIGADLLQFALPGLTVLLVGLVVCSYDGYDGLTSTLWGLVLRPSDAALLSVHQIVGLALFVAGLGLAIIAACTLGRSYSSTLVTREGHGLVTHGVYRHVRHPLYLGVLVVLVIAVPVYSQSPLGFAVLSLLVPIFLNRIRLEERLLTEQLGEAYREYVRSTRKLVPFVH